MRPCGVDCFGARIDAGHGEAQARHWFCDKASAAPDVERGEPVEWPQRRGIAMEVGCQMLADKAEPRRIDAVEHSKTSLGIPPAFGLCSKAADFLGIDG